MAVIRQLLSRKPPEILYHYTSQDGLLGILRTKVLWASKVQYLNDAGEFKLALKLARRELEERCNKTTSETSRKELLSMLAEIAGIDDINVCVCSFSEEKDLLSQWRGYCPRGAGYSVGFESSTLTEDASWVFTLAPCTYDPKEHLAIIRELIDAKLDIRDVEVSERQERAKKTRQSEFFNPLSSFKSLLTRFAPMLKHETFSEEKEWRIISMPLLCGEPGFKYRPGPSFLVPYFEYPLPEGRVRLKEVVVGPTPHPKLALNSVHSFLLSRGIEDCSLINSAIPYRDW